MDYLSMHNLSQDCSIWEQTFHDFPELEWYYFRCTQKARTKISPVKPRGACRFHNYLDVSSWVPEEVH